jgi:hypothetical protein
MDFGIAETGIARGSPPGTTTEVLRFGVPFVEIRVVSERLLIMCGSFFYCTFGINVSFVLVISCECLVLFPFTGKGMNNIFIHELISYQQGYLINLIKLGNTFPKGKRIK